MKVAIEYLGEVEYEASDVFLFPKGLYGFEDCKRFLIVQNPHMEMPFYHLASLDRQDLVFMLTNPFLFIENYDFEIPDKMVEMLSIEEIQDVTIYSMIVIPEDPKNTTTNLKAPLIVNHTMKMGAQCILADGYSSRHELFRKEANHADSI